MAERIRNFFRFNILPVLPYLRKKNRGTAVNLCILILFLFAMNTAQIVHEASKIIEADAAGGEEVHLICRNTTWEQADALRRTAKTFSKRRDGSFRIEYIRQSPRLYEKRYNIGLRFVRNRKTGAAAYDRSPCRRCLWLFGCILPYQIDWLTHDSRHERRSEARRTGSPPGGGGGNPGIL